MKHTFLFAFAALVLVAGCGGSSTEASPKIDADQAGTLLVQTAGRASFSETRLWLEETSPQTAWRASDRQPGTGMVSTESFVSLWEQEEIFAAQPLTSQFTCTVDGKAVDYRIELLAPTFYGGFWRGELSPSQQQCMATSACRLQMFLRANDLTYQIRIVDGPVPLEPATTNCDEGAHLFIIDDDQRLVDALLLP
jgi:hypothetical protein